MNTCGVVVLEKDSRIAHQLVQSLQHHFQPVRVTTSSADLREEIARRRANLAIVDMEHLCVGEVRQIHNEFPCVEIVCTHRLADEEMWAQALEAGATDLCGSSDLPSILRSVLGHAHDTRSAA